MKHPFAAGVTLNEFKAVSTDANWMEAFIHDSLHGVHKLVQLEALAIYFDTDTESLEKGPEERSETIQALKDMVGLNIRILNPSDKLCSWMAHTITNTS